MTVSNGRALQLKSYRKMLSLSIGVVISAFLIGCGFNNYFPLPVLAADILECSGYVLWGTGLAKPKIDSLTHSIPSKAFYNKMQLLCSELGIFVFVLARTLAVP